MMAPAAREGTCMLQRRAAHVAGVRASLLLLFGMNLPVLSNLPGDRARSRGQPFSIRACSVPSLIPSCPAHCDIDLRSPLNSMKRVFLLFAFCSFGVAQRQLSLQ